MNAIIIEDEKLAADRLEEMLSEVAPSIKVAAKKGSIKESVKWLMENDPDLIFLDIQLSDGLSFNIFDQVETNKPVIFTTAYDQYAIKAFRLNSIAYLLKPIRKNELKESLEKLQHVRSSFTIDFERLSALIEGRQPEYKKRFLIQFGTKFKKIDVSDIAYFYSQDKSTLMRTFKGHTYPADQTLDMLETLIDPGQFFRINRKYYVNMDAIQNMTAFSRGRIKIDLSPLADSPEDTVVSIDRSADFRNWMNG